MFLMLSPAWVFPQRACYLSLNPQKDETIETEKSQYTLPDGSTLDVSGGGYTSAHDIARREIGSIQSCRLTDPPPLI